MRNSAYRKIYLNINNRCNNNCINCLLPSNLRKDTTNISLTKIGELFSRIHSLKKTDIIEISGGEPTLHPQFFEICKFLRKKYPSKIALLTNAEFFSDENNAKKIKNLIDDVVTTLYTSNKKIHDTITKTKGSFDNKITGLKNLEKEGINLHIKTLLMKQTYKDIPKLVKYCCNKFGNSLHININSVHIINTARENYKEVGIMFSDTVKYVEKAIDYAKEKKRIISFFMPMCLIDPSYWNSCPVGFGEMVKRSLSITPNGKLGKARNLLKEFIVKPRECKSCKLSKRCFWPWKGYKEIFGLQELKPI